MRFVHTFKHCLTAVAVLAGVAVAEPVLGQSGASAVAPPVVAPPALPALGPTVAAAQGGSNIQERVRSRSTNSPNREDKTLIGLDDSEGKGHVNAIFGGFSEGAGFAGGLNITSGESLQNVEVYGDAIVSIRGYYQGEVGAIFGRESNLQGNVRYRYTRRKRDNFFGLGPFAERESTVESFAVGGVPYSFTYGGETNYESENRSLAGSIYYNFTDRVQAGVYAEQRSTSIYEGTDDADPSIFALYTPYIVDCAPANGVQPRRALVPGLGGSRIFSFGGFVEYDGRNNEDGLTKGGYLYARVATHSDVGDDARRTESSEFGWTQFTLDARGYIPLGSDRLSLALRLYTDLNSPRDNKTIPFNWLSRMGGNSSLRGFDTFRFHGEKELLYQGEVRYTVLQLRDKQKEPKPEQGVDVIFFGDLGQVWGKGFDYPCGPDVTGFDLNRGNDFDSDNYEADFGVGASYRLSKGFAIRVDFAHSNERSGVVRLTFSRGF